MAFIAVSTCAAGLPLKVSMFLKTSSARTGPSMPKRESGGAGEGDVVAARAAGAVCGGRSAAACPEAWKDAQRPNKSTTTANIFSFIARTSIGGICRQTTSQGSLNNGFWDEQ